MTRVQTQAANYCLSSSESAFLSIINNHRASRGLVQLRASKILGAAAKDKALDFNQGKPGVYGPYFAHTSPDGVTAEQNKINHGYPSAAPGWGEIILWSKETAQQAFNDWLASPDHRPSIEDSRFREIGIAGNYGVRYQSTYWGVWVVEFGNGSTAVASNCGSTEPPPPTPSTYAVDDQIFVADGPVNIRSGAGTGFSIVGSLPTNAQMCVLAGPTSANGYTWYRIQTTGGSVAGWIAGEFTGLTSSGGCTAAPPPPASFAVGDRLISSGTVTVRETANASGTVVQTLGSSSQMCVLKGPETVSGTKWYQIRTTGGTVTGWVTEQNLAMHSAGICLTAEQPYPPYNVGDHIIVADGPLNVRSTASTSGSVVGSLATDAHMCVLEGPTVANGYKWYRIRTTGGTVTGWVAGQFTSLYDALNCT